MEKTYVMNGRWVVRQTGEVVDGKVMVALVGFHESVPTRSRKGRKPSLKQPVELSTLVEQTGDAGASGEQETQAQVVAA